MVLTIMVVVACSNLVSKQCSSLDVPLPIFAQGICFIVFCEASSCLFAHRPPSAPPGFFLGNENFSNLAGGEQASSGERPSRNLLGRFPSVWAVLKIKVDSLAFAYRGCSFIALAALDKTLAKHSFRFSIHIMIDRFVVLTFWFVFQIVRVYHVVNLHQCYGWWKGMYECRKFVTLKQCGVWRNKWC